MGEGTTEEYICTSCDIWLNWLHILRWLRDVVLFVRGECKHAWEIGIGMEWMNVTELECVSNSKIEGSSITREMRKQCGKMLIGNHF